SIIYRNFYRLYFPRDRGVHFSLRLYLWNDPAIKSQRDITGCLLMRRHSSREKKHGEPLYRSRAVPSPLPATTNGLRRAAAAAAAAHRCARGLLRRRPLLRAASRLGAAANAAATGCVRAAAAAVSGRAGFHRLQQLRRRTRRVPPAVRPVTRLPRPADLPELPRYVPADAATRLRPRD
ncbi:hypothetical protein PENTCL1PPCAC_1257, partial [Pristionchus entomophagus]